MLVPIATGAEINGIEVSLSKEGVESMVIYGDKEVFKLDSLTKGVGEE